MTIKTIAEGLQALADLPKLSDNCGPVWEINGDTNGWYVTVYANDDYGRQIEVEAENPKLLPALRIALRDWPGTIKGWHVVKGSGGDRLERVFG